MAPNGTGSIRCARATQPTCPLSLRGELSHSLANPAQQNARPCGGLGMSVGQPINPDGTLAKIQWLRRLQKMIASTNL